MLTRGEAASVYQNVNDLLLHKEYFFHTVDGVDFPKGSLTYKTFLENISKFEYIDTDDATYAKFYINPLLRVLLISAASGDDKVLEFNKLTFELLELIYEQLHMAVSHGYRIAIEDARKGIGELFKTDRSIDTSA